MGRLKRVNYEIKAAHEDWTLIKMGILTLSLKDIDDMPYDVVQYFIGFAAGEAEGKSNGR